MPSDAESLRHPSDARAPWQGGRAERVRAVTGQRPSIGRVVHYVSHGTPPRADGSQAYGSECRAAVIAGIPDIGGPYTDLETLEGLPSDLVSLVVLNPSGLFFNDAEHDEDGHRGGSWHWPERAG